MFGDSCNSSLRSFETNSPPHPKLVSEIWGRGGTRPYQVRVQSTNSFRGQTIHLRIHFFFIDQTWPITEHLMNTRAACGVTGNSLRPPSDQRRHFLSEPFHRLTSTINTRNPQHRFQN